MTFTVTLSKLSSTYKKRCRQRITDGRALRNHTDRGHGGRRPTSTRIDQMTVTLTVVLKELLFTATGGKRTISKSQYSQSPQLGTWIPQADEPTIAVFTLTQGSHAARTRV